MITIVVCERVVCGRVVCERVVCGRVVCERVVCERVVCERVVCERVVCERVVCEIQVVMVTKPVFPKLKHTLFSFTKGRYDYPKILPLRQRNNEVQTQPVTTSQLSVAPHLAPRSRTRWSRTRRHACMERHADETRLGN